MRGAHEFSYGVFEGNVADPAFHFDFESAQFDYGLIELARGARAQRQVCAGAGVGGGDGFADTSAGAGDERDFVFEGHGKLL